MILSVIIILIFKAGRLMKKIVFAGTFDPITNGHFWIIKESLTFADKVLVFISENPTKKTMFDVKTRMEFIEKTAKENGIGDAVEVHAVKSEYVAQKAIAMGAQYMVRGIRSASDFDYEMLIQKTNRDVLKGAKTLFLMPPRDLESVSSSFVKLLVGPIGWSDNVKQFVPSVVFQAWMKRYLHDELESVGLFSYKNMKDFFDFAVNQYSQSNRHYHNLEHIVQCVTELKWFQANTQQKLSSEEYAQILVAIIAHDVVYGQKSDKSDEQLSAQKVNEYLGSYFNEAANLVLITQHLTQSQKYSLSRLEKVMISIDLSILAQDWDAYRDYSVKISKEYGYLPFDVYNEGRKSALKKILSKPVLFPASEFSDKEVRARENIQKELNEFLT